MATFLQPGAVKELPLDEIIRDTVVRDLTSSTHPDVVRNSAKTVSRNGTDWLAVSHCLRGNIPNDRAH